MGAEDRCFAAERQTAMKRLMARTWSTELPGRGTGNGERVKWKRGAGCWERRGGNMPMEGKEKLGKGGRCR